MCEHVISANGLSRLFTSDSSWRRTCLVSLLLVNLAVLVSANQFQGRHVCSRTRFAARPIHIRQSYKRPQHTLDLARCAAEGEQPCNRTRTTYKTVYRSVMKMQFHPQKVPSCCPGWKKRSPFDTGCLAPECSLKCQHGGRCVGPETCMCPRGYAGRYCQVDIDECSGRNSCDQKCINLPGTYECACSDGFVLGKDNSSCELCLTCTPEFQELLTKVDSLPTQQDQAVMEVRKEEEEERRNIQADMMEEMKKQSQTFDKLQSQYDAIVDIQKQMDVLPEISDRLDNLTGLQAEVNDLKTLKVKVESVEEHVDEGLASIKGSQTNLEGALESFVQKMGEHAIASSQIQSDAMARLQEQLDDMAARIDWLEEEKSVLEANLTSALAQYDAAMSAQHQREATTTQPTTTTSTTTSEIDNPYGNGVPYTPLDRIDSLDRQISMLEEKVSMCNCNEEGQHDPYGYYN